MPAAEPFPDTLDKGLHMPPSTSGSIGLRRFAKILIQLDSFARRPLTTEFYTYFEPAPGRHRGETLPQHVFRAGASDPIANRLSDQHRLTRSFRSAAP